MENYDLIVIGAGPAGLMAAITAAKKGKRVLLLEKNEVIGRKLLATGNGRCNLTNTGISVKRYHGATPEFVNTTLQKFGQHQVTDFFESLGVALKEEGRGRVFPRTNQASTIVEVLKHELRENNVTLKTNVVVTSVKKPSDFLIQTEGGPRFSAKKVILTTGGKAAYQFGSSGDGLYWASKLGHQIIPIYAALVPLETVETWTKEAQGIKVEARVTTKIGLKVIKESTGDCLFTHFGLSGPAIMAHAGDISPLVDKHTVKIFLDLYPEITERDLDSKLEEIFRNNPKKTVRNILSGLLPAKLAPIILDISNIKRDINNSEISKLERLKIVRSIKELPLTVKKVRPLKEAQVSRGGVDTTEIYQDTLESKIVKGLYFAGEIIDVDGDSGGFNLQWAWSSGFVAGQP